MKGRWKDSRLGEEGEGFDPSMRLHYTRVVCERNSRRSNFD